MSSRRERFRAIARQAREKTNRRLDEELAQLTRLSAEEIERLLPRRADKERLAQLLEIVSSRTAQHRKVAALRENIDELGSVVVRVLGAVL